MNVPKLFKNVTKNILYVNTSKLSSNLIIDLNTVDLSYDLYDKHNSKNALIIAHGLFGSKQNWRSVAKRINEYTQQKTYAVDLRNHGETIPYVPNMTYFDMANDLKKFIINVVKNKDQVNKVTVLGHSMGGKTAMTLCLIENNLIDKLIVADISPGVSPSSDTIKYIVDKICSIKMSKLNSNIYKARKEVDEIFCELPILKKDTGTRKWLLTRLAEKDGQIIWLFNINSIVNHVLGDIMHFPVFESRFSNPTLFLGGALSDYIAEKDIPAIKKYFLNYKILEVPNAGHNIHFENPSFTIQAINEFIN